MCFISKQNKVHFLLSGWCDFLNYFDSSVHFELPFVNTAANKDIYSERIVIPLKGDNHDSIRKEYSKMLRDQLAMDDNGLIKTKYLTFGVDADSMKRSSAPISVPTVVS